MKALRNLLDGKKTYIGSILIGLLGLLWSFGQVDDATVKWLGPLITGLTGVAMRMGVKKSSASAPPSRKP